MTRSELLARYESGERNFDGAVLNDADLVDANLEYACLERARLEGANLERARLERANLVGTRLERANLVNANLEYANLVNANLERARLEYANLEYANLERASVMGASLVGASLVGASLERARLRGACLRGVVLTGTCLDPESTPNGDCGAFERTDGGRCIGYRTSRPLWDDSREYRVRGAYRAPVFSVASTPCHPGLYVSPTPEDVRVFCAQWDVPCPGIVRVTFRPEDCHHAGDKWRVKAFTVVGEVE